MGKGDYLGEFEIVVLLAVARLGDEAYGMTIRMEIEERTGREVALGTVYNTLRRLEHKGYLDSELGDPTPERGGKAKRFYALQPEGAEALARSREMFEQLWSGLREPLA